jgi:hypothetical protein
MPACCVKEIAPEPAAGTQQLLFSDITSAPLGGFQSLTAVLRVQRSETNQFVRCIH